jgi:hypothetical protein
LQRTILDAPREGWELIHILGEQDMDIIVGIEEIQNPQRIPTIPPSL